MKHKKRHPKMCRPGNAKAAATSWTDLDALGRHFADMLQHIKLIAVLLDTKGRVVYGNNFLFRLTGFSRQAVLGHNWFNRFVPSTRPDVKRLFLRGLGGGVAPHFENPIRDRKGDLHLIAWRNTVLRNSAGTVIGIAALGEDVGARRREEAELRRITRAAVMRARCNQLLVQSKDEASLLKGFCHLLVKQGGYPLAWVGFANNQNATSLNPVAFACLKKNDLHPALLAWADKQGGRGRCRRAIHARTTGVIPHILSEPAFNPGRAAAFQKREVSAALIPLLANGRPLGVLMVFSAGAETFVAEELKCLEELAETLALGIEILHARAKQEQAEKALRASEEKFRTIFFQTASDGLSLWDVRKRRFHLINQSLLNLMGCTLEEFNAIGCNQRHSKEDLPFILQKAYNVGKYGVIERAETHFKRKDGRVIFADVVLSRIRFGGHDYTLAEIRDISVRKRMERALEQSSEKLRTLLARLEQAREEERARVSRDIHDDFGQNLTAIKMNLSQIEQVAAAAPLSPPLMLVLKRAADSIDLADQTLVMMQELVAELRPGALDRLGLVPALESEAYRFQERYGIQCAVAAPAVMPDLPNDIATALFRIFQECLTNIARHAKASQVLAELKTTPPRVRLRVQDNGVGIPEMALSNPASLGVLGMQERAADLGGEMVLQNRKKGGTVVAVSLPLRAKKDKPGKTKEP